MLESKFVVINRLGLHARAAAQLVRLSETFQSEISIRRTDTGTTADAKSILDVLTLAAPKGITVEITVEGTDEEKALTAVVEIFADGFGEE